MHPYITYFAEKRKLGERNSEYHSRGMECSEMRAHLGKPVGQAAGMELTKLHFMYRIIHKDPRRSLFGINARL